MNHGETKEAAGRLLTPEERELWSGLSLSLAEIEVLSRAASGPTVICACCVSKLDKLTTGSLPLLQRVEVPAALRQSGVVPEGAVAVQPTRWGYAFMQTCAGLGDEHRRHMARRESVASIDGCDFDAAPATNRPLPN